MRQAAETRFVGVLVAMHKLYGKDGSLDQVVIAEWMRGLQGYSFERVERAIKRLQRTSRYLPYLSAVVDLLDQETRDAQPAQCCYVDSGGMRCQRWGRVESLDASPVMHWCDRHRDPANRCGPAAVITGAVPRTGDQVCCLTLLDSGKRELAIEQYGHAIVTYCDRNASAIRSMMKASPIADRLDRKRRNGPKPALAPRQIRERMPDPKPADAGDWAEGV